METTGPIPVVLDVRELAARLRFDPLRAGFDSLDDLVALAGRLIAPRAVYEVAYVGARGERTVEVGGVTFESPLVREKLEGANKVFPFIVTVGPELEREAAARDDLLQQHYLEEMANFALEKAGEWLAARIEALCGVGRVASLSPGSLEDWPITEQTKLFAIFGDTERIIGVRLTDSMLMLPRKSVSGIMFPSEEGFHACQLCDRERCPGRKAPWRGGRSAAVGAGMGDRGEKRERDKA